MSRWFKYLSLVVGGLGAWAGGELARPALAQDGAMTELYGYGVHRFYAGDYAEAQRVLNMVIEAGIEDPRPHFFRGLTQYRMGALDAAQVDFEHAADLEARGRRAVNVSFALQRIQGAVRHDIEMARLMARVSVYREQMTQPQPQPTGGAPRPGLNIPVPPVGPEADIDLPPSLAPEPAPGPAVEPPPAAVIPPVDAAPGAVPPPDTEVNPFGDDQPVPAPSTEPETAPGVEPANPFGDSAAPATPPVPAEPAVPTVPEEPAGLVDPFATPDEPAAPTTPEATPEASEAAPEAAPEAPAEDADPFGA